jgi:hypothetical protein
LIGAGHEQVLQIFQDILRPLATIEKLQQRSRVAMSLLNYGIMRDLSTAEMCL